MNKKILEDIKKKLLEDKARLIKELSRFSEKDETLKNDFDTLFPDFGRKEEENALEVTSYSDNLPVEHSLELKLKDINDALEKIKKGSYGACEECGKKIDEERLKILSTARFCVECYQNKGGKK